ncbi:MAG: radical SAM protein [Pseudomonadota bacterium]
MDPSAANGAFLQVDPTGRTVMVGAKKSPDQVMTKAFGEPYLDYRRAWAEAERFAKKTDWPLHLDVDVNVTCNLACVMCPLGQKKFPVPYDRKFLEFDLYRRVLTEGASRGLAALRLGVTGEPLLRPDISDFVRLARDLGVLDIMLITNGLLLTPEMSGTLMDAGLTRLMVSLDAIRPETYLRLRPGGNFQQTMANVMTFLELRNSRGRSLPLLRVSFVRTALNHGEQDEFKAFWESRADYLGFQEYSDLMETGGPGLFPPDRRRTTDFRCADPWQRMSLFVNGDLFPCCSDFGRLRPIGNANRAGVEQAWKSEAAEKLRELHREGRWAEHPICRRCAAVSTGASGS